MKKIGIIVLILGLTVPFLGLAQNKRVVFFQVSLKLRNVSLRPQDSVILPRYLENLSVEPSNQNVNPTVFKMNSKAYRALFDRRLLNYECYLKSRQTIDVLLPNRNYTGGHLADDYTWDKVSFDQNSL